MPITDTQLKLITEEAEKHALNNWGLYLSHEKSRENFTSAYIAVATLYQEKLNLEREKAKVLVEGLEKIRDQKMLPGETDTRFAFNRNWHIAVDTLAAIDSATLNH